MQHTALRALRSAPYVIVEGNEKGGSGKTTLAVHVAIALLKAVKAPALSIWTAISTA